MTARICAPAEGRKLNVLGSPLVEKAASDDLSGGAAVFVMTVEPAGGPPAHVHDEADEFFFVLEGVVDLWVGGRHAKLSSGMSATLPRGVPHRFDNRGERAARVLVVVTPGEGAAFFDDVDREQPELPHEFDKVVATLARHDIRLAA